MDDFSFNILKLYSLRNSLSLIQLQAILNKDPFYLAEPVSYLRDKEYLEIEPTHAILESVDDNSSISLNTPLVITYLGKIALEAETKERKHFKFNEFRAWVTLGIAIAAFILSIISLFIG